MSAAAWPVVVDPLFGCWQWQDHRDQRDGRALLWRGPHPIAAANVVYEAELGPLPKGRVPDHLCRNTACVAPHHLEPVTKDENERRKSWPYRARRTTCAKGHTLADAIVTPQMGRLCRTCEHEARSAA